MADTKTFNVICPNPECLHAFLVEKTPEQLADPQDLTMCPECTEEWFSDYDEDTGELTLVDEDEDEEEEDDSEWDDDDED